jgi:putative ABC transport system permease protein
MPGAAPVGSTTLRTGGVPAPAAPRQPAGNEGGATPGAHTGTTRPAHPSIKGKADVFFLTYLWRELRHRFAQAALIALGLAVGVGLVVTVTAASAGVTNAQSTVLHSLYGIGTDITVTTAAPSPKSGPSPGQASGLSVGDVGVLSASSVASIAKFHGVAAAAGGLTLTDLAVPSGSSNAGGFPVPATFSADGVDLTHLGLGPFASAKINSGRSFAGSDATSDMAVVDSRYAAANKLSVGSTITIGGARFKIVGIAGQAQGGGTPDVYIPLGVAQALASLTGSASLTHKVDVIYVAATSASAVPAVRSEITHLLPTATVTTSGDLASQVTGSLASATSLADDLGRWLAVVVLLAAFAVASLLTMAAVARRTRELGMLKALGWRTRHIIAQIIGESAITGVIGAAMGVALGFAGAALVDAAAPKLSATAPRSPGSGTTSTVAVHINAHVATTTILLAVLLAIAGALIAGSLGGWRASRLSPADALTRAE